MEFIINRNLRFYNVDNSLSDLNNEMETMILSRLCSELLCLLVKHNHHPVSRETLLNELWEKRGLNASSNNLNNYISMLRRALAKFGHQELITTIPRYGFVFDADIEYIHIQPSISDNNILPAEGAKITLSKDAQPRQRKPFEYCRFSLITSLMAILFFSPELYRLTFSKIHREEIFRFDRCRVYLTDDITRRIDDLRLDNRIKDIVNQEKLNCHIKTNIYYYEEHKINAAGDNIVLQLLSYCPYDSKAPCINYHIRKHEM